MHFCPYLRTKQFIYLYSFFYLGCVMHRGAVSCAVCASNTAFQCVYLPVGQIRPTYPLYLNPPGTCTGPPAMCPRADRSPDSPGRFSLLDLFPDDRRENVGRKASKRHNSPMCVPVRVRGIRRVDYCLTAELQTGNQNKPVI